MPAEGGNGLAMRLGVALEALTRVADVDLLLLPVSGDVSAPSPLLQRLDVRPHVVSVAGRGDTQFALLSRIAHPATRIAAFRSYGRGSRHAPLSAPVLDDVRRFAAGKDYALVHVERLYVLEAGLATGCRRLSVDLDEDDAWSWRREALQARSMGESKRAEWEEAEAEAEDRLLGRLVASEATAFISNGLDARRLRHRHPALAPAVVPNSVRIPDAARRQDDGATLVFVGSLGYPPNADGMLWFIDEIWPAIRAANPGARLRIAGSGAPRALRALGHRRGIELLGFVDDLDALYAGATLAVAPLLAGGGTRIKLLEAAAHQVPIVATPLAAQGLGMGRSAIWRASTAAGFAAAVAEALADPGERARRAERAFTLVRRKHDRASVIADLAVRFSRLLTT
jgi:polysaccharide biosynthesis protein PslH